MQVVIVSDNAKFSNEMLIVNCSHRQCSQYSLSKCKNLFFAIISRNSYIIFTYTAIKVQTN